MQVIPSVISPETDSDAEKRVFKDFKRVTALGTDATVYHSLRLSEHEYKVEGELDFVVVSRKGLLFLEVKGGGVSRDEEGIWSYSNRYGRTNQNSEGPFLQVDGAMRSIINGDDIRTLCGRNEYRDMVYGIGVIFPDCKFSDINTVEWESDIVLDYSTYKNASDLDNYIRNLMDYWRRKVGASHKRKIGREHLARIKNYLRPKFEKVPTLHHQSAKVARRMEELTEEQYRFLDAAPYNDRILCFGGAGTGKTFLAAEIARRHSEEGSRTLFTCRSRPLAANLASRLSGHENVEVCSFMNLAKTTEDKYDILIMDEGQDLLNFECLDLLDDVLKGGIENGVWRFFYDGNNQGGIYNEFEPDAVEFLRSLNAVTIPLTRNCRNTHQIVVQTKMLTAADLGTPSAGRGLPVSYKYYDTNIKGASLLHSWINNLLKEDVRHEDITILSPVSFKQSIASSLPKSMRNQISVLTDENAFKFPFDCISFATIEDFKGLENRFVSIIDISEISESARSKSNIYVGMSRSQINLTLILPESLKHVVSDIQIRNIDLLSSDMKMS